MDALQQLDLSWAAAKLVSHLKAVLGGEERTSPPCLTLSKARVSAVTVQPLLMSTEALTAELFCHLLFASFITYDITRVNG